MGGGALLVSILLIPGILGKIDSPGFLITGILLMAVTYIFLILRTKFSTTENWITDVPLALGLVFLSIPLYELIKNNNPN